MKSKRLSSEDMPGLEVRIRDIENRQRIVDLRSGFHHHLNSQDWHELAGLFSVSGVLDYGDFGFAQGRGEIYEYYSALIGKIVEFMPGASHAVLKNVPTAHKIELSADGSSAIGSCYFQEMVRFDDNNFVHLSMGRFFDKYVLVGDQWVFDSIELEHYWVVPKNEGWTADW
ncbi:nuclear transport factor 2 family protein [Rhodococcus sp. IEGM 1330]|uniref:nuclear transport factor 2 family protein n=1 Tax=Rhodococcus sp. IEGM 1330 TaxID=3082225 RepID=UPI0029554C16|nr:nuclear transport factor 2 family protein [Rhodococcus sp. IEGM 1330]MDV8022181.1 nuclear transport factor 2 family protein [Rhodococcus sp. IEGM 1330]